MRPYLGPPWTDSHPIWAVDVFHHAPPIHGIQNTEIQKNILWRHRFCTLLGLPSFSPFLPELYYWSVKNPRPDMVFLLWYFKSMVIIFYTFPLTKLLQDFINFLACSLIKSSPRLDSKEALDFQMSYSLIFCEPTDDVKWFMYTTLSLHWNSLDVL